jgi:ethanolamine utilization protein EutN
MILGRVSGSLWSTIHHSVMANKKILVVDRLDCSGKPTGGYIIALDSVGAGAGETVLVLDEGNGSRQILNDPRAPVRSMVVGIVDGVQKVGN